jgi:hypothetical protein
MRSLLQKRRDRHRGDSFGRVQLVCRSGTLKHTRSPPLRLNRSCRRQACAIGFLPVTLVRFVIDTVAQLDLATVLAADEHERTDPRGRAACRLPAFEALPSASQGPSRT